MVKKVSLVCVNMGIGFGGGSKVGGIGCLWSLEKSGGGWSRESGIGIFLSTTSTQDFNAQPAAIPEKRVLRIFRLSKPRTPTNSPPI